jgi:hypothetical protein
MIIRFFAARLSLAILCRRVELVDYPQLSLAGPLRTLSL